MVGVTGVPVISMRSSFCWKVTSLGFFFTGDDPLGSADPCIFWLDAMSSLSPSISIGVSVFERICKVVCCVFFSVIVLSGLFASCHLVPLPTTAEIAWRDGETLFIPFGMVMLIDVEGSKIASHRVM